jgi:hypothetical protein
VLTYRQIYDRVKPLGAWKDDTIWQHLMSRVVNLPVARERWPGRQAFLFLHGDGRYEFYDASIHPAVVDEP